MSAPNTKKSGQEPAQANTLIVEWKIAEDEREWQLAQAMTLAIPSQARRWERRWRAAIVVAFLCLLATGGWIWHQANAGLNQIEAELQGAVDADEWRARQDQRMERKPSGNTLGVAQVGVAQGIAKAEQLPRRAEIQLRDLRTEWAVVQVITKQGELSYRQTRLYRRDVNGWYVAAPTADSWGAPRTLETEHFVFHYFALDTEAVAEAAAKLDALYPDLVASYPFDSNSYSKLRIWVSPEHSLAGTMYTTLDGTMKVASPALYFAPTEISEGDILAQAVLLNLLNVLTTQSRESQLLHFLHNSSHNDMFTRHLFMSRLYALLESLRLWHLWNGELPLATLHKPTIQWVYDEVQGRYTPPDFDAELCPLHQLWEAVPYLIRIPLFCSDPKQLERYQIGRYFPVSPPHRLAEIQLYANTTPDEPYANLTDVERLGVVTLIDYVATTYGRESIATLITNAPAHSTWKTLIPAAFGVTYDDFEAGWQAHLQVRYGISATDLP